jgi:hypothetical protein
MSTRLWTTADWAGVWQEGFPSWLEEFGGKAWTWRKPAAILVPARSVASYAKERILDRGGFALGLHFLTPSDLRRKMTGAFRLGGSLPSREQLRLLLAMAAEKAGGTTGRVVASSPHSLLRTIDLLSAGGWHFECEGPAATRAIVREYGRLLRRCEFVPQYERDREIFDRAKAGPKLFSSLFVVGFDGAHWPLFPLLAGAVRASENATIFLRHPRDVAGDLDEAWIGTWEEEFHASEPFTAEPIVPACEDLFAGSARGRNVVPHRDAENVTRIAGRDESEQADAIVHQTSRFLASEECTRLGLIFSRAGALSRLVAARLADAGMAHNDAIAHPSPGLFDSPDWSAWIALQESQRLPAFLGFLNALPEIEALFAGLISTAIYDGLRRAFEEFLLDDLRALAAWLAAQSRKPGATELAVGLRKIALLPERAQWSEFLAETRVAWLTLGWQKRGVELEQATRDWSGKVDGTLSRDVFLRWLRDSLSSHRPDRAAEGSHPYSRTHLLTLAQAEGQAWSHLIVCDMNAPGAISEGGWLSEEEITALNERARRLNKRATLAGDQGEGHWSVAPGITMCLGPAQRRDLAARSLAATIESATKAVALVAKVEEAQFVGGRWHRLGKANELRRPLENASLQQTLTAFTARRTRGRPFGEYEFALRAPAGPVIRFSATEWEAVLPAPAQAWMTHFFGVRPRDESPEPAPWNLAIGRWVHRWLRQLATDAFSPIPSREAASRRVGKAAANFRENIGGLLRELHLELPEWWHSTWQQARQLALTFAERVADAAGVTHCATEWVLPETQIPAGETGRLRVRGRIDLLLTSSPPRESLAPVDAWIVDYKTGDRKSLRPARASDLESRIAVLHGRFISSDSLQLALYALALEQHGANHLGLSLLTPELDLTEPQVSEADICPAAQGALLRGLCRMQDTGIFGQRGQLRDEYSYADELPLATLRIDSEVLKEKWVLTHPNFGGANSEAIA